MEFVSPIMRFSDVKMLPQGKRHPDGKQAILDFGKYQLSIISNGFLLCTGSLINLTL